MTAPVNEDPVSCGTLPASLAQGEAWSFNNGANLVNLDLAASYWYASVNDTTYPLGDAVVDNTSAMHGTVPANLPPGSATLLLRGLAGGSSGTQTTITGTAPVVTGTAARNVQLGEMWNFRNVNFDTDYVFNYVEASINGGAFGQIYNSGIHSFSTYSLPGGPELTSSSTFDLVFRLVSFANGPSSDVHVTLHGDGWSPDATAEIYSWDVPNLNVVHPGDIITVAGVHLDNAGDVIYYSPFVDPYPAPMNVLSATSAELTVPRRAALGPGVFVIPRNNGGSIGFQVTVIRNADETGPFVAKRRGRYTPPESPAYMDIEMTPVTVTQGDLHARLDQVTYPQLGVIYEPDAV